MCDGDNVCMKEINPSDVITTIKEGKAFSWMF